MAENGILLKLWCGIWPTILLSENKNLAQIMNFEIVSRISTAFQNLVMKVISVLRCNT